MVLLSGNSSNFVPVDYMFMIKKKIFKNVTKTFQLLVLYETKSTIKNWKKIYVEPLHQL